MARDLNKVMLTGRLGRDVEMRVTPSGKSVSTFSVASSRNVKQADGSYKEETEWFRVVAWDRLAETCGNFLKKGSHVLIEGRLQTREWDNNEGQKQRTTEVVATEMIMLGSKQDNAGQPALAGVGATEAYGQEGEIEDIPF